MQRLTDWLTSDLDNVQGSTMISLFSQQRRKSTNHIFGNCFKSSNIVKIISIGSFVWLFLLDFAQTEIAC